MKVLLVEDDPAIAGSVTTSLSNAGMTVHHCATGADAIAAAQRKALLFSLDGFDRPSHSLSNIV